MADDRPTVGPNIRDPADDDELAGLLHAITVAGTCDFADARPLAAQAYHSEALLRWEIEHLFRKEWICAGREDDVPSHADFLTLDVAGCPVIVIRQADGGVRAFVNACAHRHSKLTDTWRGHSRLLVCPYHAWSYRPDGSLKKAPYFPDIEAKRPCLTEVSVARWMGFIYVSLDPDPGDLQASLRAFERDAVAYDFAAYETVVRERAVFAGNWKNLIENFVESYHLFRVHRDTFPLADPLSGVTPDDYMPGPYDPRICYHTAPDMLTGCVFPAHLIDLSSKNVLWISVQPAGLGAISLDWGLAVAPGTLDGMGDANRDQWIAETKRYYDRTNGEDKAVIEAVWRGMKAGCESACGLHSSETNIWHFYRYLAGRVAAA